MPCRGLRFVLSVVFYVVNENPQSRIRLKSCKKQKKTPETIGFQVLFGAAGRIRTADLILTKGAGKTISTGNSQKTRKFGIQSNFCSISKIAARECATPCFFTPACTPGLATSSPARNAEHDSDSNYNCDGAEPTADPALHPASDNRPAFARGGLPNPRHLHPSTLSA